GPKLSSSSDRAEAPAAQGASGAAGRTAGRRAAGGPRPRESASFGDVPSLSTGHPQGDDLLLGREGRLSGRPALPIVNKSSHFEKFPGSYPQAIPKSGDRWGERGGAPSTSAPTERRPRRGSHRGDGWGIATSEHPALTEARVA